MRIAVLGAGRMGSAIGRLWAQAGHAVVFSYARDSERLAALARDVGHGAASAPVAQAVRDADLLLLAVPWSQVSDVLAQAGDLRGRVLVDCGLPMTADDTQLAIGWTSSGAEQLQQRTGAKLVKAFNTVPAEFIAADRQRLAPLPSLFFAGDDAAAKTTVAGLIRDAGFDPVDAGPLAMARHLEPFALLMGQLAYVQQPQPEIGYRLLRAPQSR